MNHANGVHGTRALRSVFREDNFHHARGTLIPLGHETSIIEGAGEEELDDDDVFAENIEHALSDHVSHIFDKIDLALAYVEDWLDEVVLEVSQNLEDVYDGPDYLPLTDHIDFTDSWGTLLYICILN